MIVFSTHYHILFLTEILYLLCVDITRIFLDPQMILIVDDMLFEMSIIDDMLLVKTFKIC